MLRGSTAKTVPTHTSVFHNKLDTNEHVSQNMLKPTAVQWRLFGRGCKLRPARYTARKLGAGAGARSIFVRPRLGHERGLPITLCLGRFEAICRRRRRRTGGTRRRRLPPQGPPGCRSGRTPANMFCTAHPTTWAPASRPKRRSPGDRWAAPHPKGPSR